LEVGFAGLEGQPAMMKSSCIAAKSSGFIQHNTHVPIPDKKENQSSHLLAQTKLMPHCGTAASTRHFMVSLDNSSVLAFQCLEFCEMFCCY
jgi:hypothetical protein